MYSTHIEEKKKKLLIILEGMEKWKNSSRRFILRIIRSLYKDPIWGGFAFLV